MRLLFVWVPCGRCGGAAHAEPRCLWPFPRSLPRPICKSEWRCSRRGRAEGGQTGRSPGWRVRPRPGQNGGGRGMEKERWSRRTTERELAALQKPNMSCTVNLPPLPPTPPSAALTENPLGNKRERGHSVLVSHPALFSTPPHRLAWPPGLTSLRFPPQLTGAG